MIVSLKFMSKFLYYVLLFIIITTTNNLIATENDNDLVYNVDVPLDYVLNGFKIEIPNKENHTGRIY